DTINVNDLTGIDPTLIIVNLAGTADGTAGDGQADSIIVNGRNSDDEFLVSGGLIGPNSGRVAVGGDGSARALPYLLAITATEGASDRLVVNALGGNDVVDASGLSATNASPLIRLTVNGGAGNDTLTGSPGIDTFLWNPGGGSDIIEGGGGHDDLTV